MTTVRVPAVAGTFYPADAAGLRHEVDTLMRRARPAALGPGRLKALLVPHAGYPYSGPVAASAYALLKGLPGIRRIALFGPAHRAAFDGVCAPTADAWATPLGALPLDKAALGALDGHGEVHHSDQPHGREHSLEVQLPFLQCALEPGFSLAPVLVGQCLPEDAAACVEALWGGPETLVVLSTDLSHYLPYEDAQALDLATASAIDACQPDGIADDQACGAYPLRGFLLLAARKGLKPVRLDLRNSGDTAGTKTDGVVGYASYAFLS